MTVTTTYPVRVDARVDPHRAAGADRRDRAGRHRPLPARPVSELGRWAQNPVLALVTPLYGAKRVMFPIPKHDQQIVTELKELIESGKFTLSKEPVSVADGPPRPLVTVSGSLMTWQSRQSRSNA